MQAQRQLLFGRPLPERVAGIDIFSRLLLLAHREERSVAFLGAKPEVLEEMQRVVARRFPGLKIAYSHHRYYKAAEAGQIAADIRGSGDPWFIVSAAPRLSRLIRTAREVNDHRPHHVAEQVVEKAKRFRSPTVACLGLTFKANVDDVRESPAIEVVGLIAKALPEVDIFVSDPYVSVMPRSLSEYGNLHLESAHQAVERADIVVLLVEHEPFKAMRHTRLGGKILYDTRGAWH